MSYHPSLESFRALASQADLVPVFREIPADLETPVSAFFKLKGDGYSFLLESVEKGELVGRYSFLGFDLSLLLRVDGDNVRYRAEGRLQDATLGDRDPLGWLRDVMAGHRVAEVPGLPLFFGGAVGYLGYDVVRRFERLPDAHKGGLGLPDSVFLLTDKVVVFDHVKQKMLLVVLAHIDEDADAAYGAACREIDRQIRALQEPIRLPQPPSTNGSGADVVSNMTREAYIAAVQRAHEYIAAGDIFQVVLSQRLSKQTPAHPWTIYRALRMLNPSPYMFYLDVGDFQLIGSSPEMLVKLEDGVAETRPIAGTRPRASDEEADRALASDLLSDPKECAEHVMLVDLGRNDLGRVCRYGSVRVPTFMEIERYSHVMHIVSSVKGQLQDGRDQFDLVRAAFPAGTVSGAPKIRAMEIIEELEPARRGAYAGAVGYFSFLGNMNTCITIRTIVMRDGEVHFQAGAGIVADSDPEREFQETLDKIAALRYAVELAEKGLE